MQLFRLRSFPIAITPDATLYLITFPRALCLTLHDLHSLVVLASADVAVWPWQPYTEAVREAYELHTAHFTPILPTDVPLSVVTELLAAVLGVVELVIHAPNAAERVASLQHQHSMRCDRSFEAFLCAWRNRTVRPVHDIDLDRWFSGNHANKAIKKVVPPSPAATGPSSSSFGNN